jgi:AraC-like DNA-binding protein
MKMSTKEEQIEKLKQELIDSYAILMGSVLIVYTIIFTFFIYDKIMSWYLIGGLIFVGYSYFLARRAFSKNLIINIYLITAPIYSSYVMIAFWNTSVASFCWLLPIPFGASIFFSRKTVLAYTVYIVLFIITGYIIANNCSFNFVPKHTQEEVMFTDTILFISNLLVISLLMYYKDKIRKLEMPLHTEKQDINTEEHRNNKSNPAESIDTESAEKLFNRIEIAMSTEIQFKNVNFSLSMLSASLNVNSAYISKCIRYKGYPNFNSYLNAHRISYVKTLLNESDLEKITLMYIYTEAGFSSQSTFNRVFKQIEGITPSEYIKTIKTKNTE